jgi:proteasome-associated ATPase
MADDRNRGGRIEMMEEVLNLLSGPPAEPDSEAAAVEKIARNKPSALRQLAQHLVSERRQIRSELAQAKVEAAKATERYEKAKATLEEVLLPPLHPAVVMRSCESGRIEVAVAGSRQIVAVHPNLAKASLRSGDEVYIDPDTGIAVSRGDPGPRVGRVATVSEHLGDRAMVRGDGDEERMVICDTAVVGDVAVGDRLLVSTEVPCALERLPTRRQSSHLLQTPPQTSFDEVGGLDTVVDELCQEVELQLFHPDLVDAYNLPILRGMTLVGPPGVGKTMLARALARFLADAAPDTRFMNVSPGSLRGSYYGQTEARIQEVFRVASAEPGLTVIFFDELDSFGARGGSPGHEIDDRVMGTLLAEIDGLERTDGVFVIGATNRLELIDDAILRPGRFGDRIVEVPRPNRVATRAILEGLLGSALPWADDESPDAAVAAAVSFLHAPEGAAGAVVRLTFSDGASQEVRARDVVSGALLASSVRDAKKSAAARQLQQGPALQGADVVDALDRALCAEARKLSSVAVARRSLSIPRANEIVSVEVPAERGISATARLRAA